MELKSTVITLNNLLKLKFHQEFHDFILPEKNKLAIPDYQREYKWEKSKIKTFVDNVMQRNKFLGIITTEVSEREHLSIVDGQQRLTTIMLVLVHLFNLCADEGETETQVEIQELISSEISGNTFFKLENGSVGDFLHFSTDEAGSSRITLTIDPVKDIYKQAKKFEEACAIIKATFDERDRTTTLDQYKQRLVDCEMLLFAQKNTANMQQGSSEEIYIDINEKAQQLDPEDIFKGHCFAVCKTIAQQSKVKKIWRSIKQQFFSMDSIFKKDNMNMGIFLHYYLLTQEATKGGREDVNEKLIIKGKNAIESRYNSPTKAIDLLTSIERYQKNLLDFSESLSVIDNAFASIMATDSQTLGNNVNQLKEANTMLREIIDCKQDMFKLPLFYLVDHYSQELANKLTYNQFSGFTYLYYVYMFLFSRIGGLRQRRFIPKELIAKISLGQDYLIQFIREIILYSKNLGFDNKSMDNTATRKQLYAILDYFECTSAPSPASSDGDLSFKLSLFPETYNVEHLVISQSRSIAWCSSDNTEYEFLNNDFSDCEAWGRQQNKWPNYILADETFNRDVLKNKDIINKLILLRGSAVKAGLPASDTHAKKHKHVEAICQHIMRTDGFDDLLTAYSNNDTKANVLNRYKAFIEKYFDEDNIEILRKDFEDQFKRRLEGLQNLIQ